MVQGPRPAEVPGCASLPLDQRLPRDARGADYLEEDHTGQVTLQEGGLQEQAAGGLAGEAVDKKAEEADYEPEEVGIVEFQGIYTPVLA